MSAVKDEEFAMKSELARYLRLEPEDIDRAVEEDKLPCLRLLGRRRFSQRFPLRGVHAWELERTVNAPREMLDFEEWRKGFFARCEDKKMA